MNTKIWRALTVAIAIVSVLLAAASFLLRTTYESQNSPPAKIMLLEAALPRLLNAPCKSGTIEPAGEDYITCERRLDQESRKDLQRPRMYRGRPCSNADKTLGRCNSRSIRPRRMLASSRMNDLAN